MYFVDFGIAILTAILFAAVLILGIGWRPGREAPVSTGLALVMAGLVFLFVAWLANLAVAPFGATVMERQWIPGILAVLLLTVLFTALLPPPRQSRATRRPAVPSEAETGEIAATEAVAVGVSVVFWVLLVLLLLGIASSYWWRG